MLTTVLSVVGEKLIMEITFKYPSYEERTIEVSEEDIENLKKYAIACVVDRMRVISLKSPYCGYEYQLAELCERYGVDVGSKLAVSNFIAACLQPETKLMEPQG